MTQARNHIRRGLLIACLAALLPLGWRVQEVAAELRRERDATALYREGLALYLQGHYAEALQIYDDLVSRHPFDEDLKRLRRDAEARLLPAGHTPGAAMPDPSLDRRLARIRRLRSFLAAVQAG